MKLVVVLEPAEEGGFVVTVPALDGCITQGDTEEEALENAQEGDSLLPRRAGEGQPNQDETRSSCQRGRGQFVSSP